MQEPGGETTIWRGTPSQWVNFGTFLACGIAALVLVGLLALAGSGGLFGPSAAPTLQIVLAALILVPVFFALKAFLQVRTTNYLVTSERVRMTRGIFSSRTDDLELYRVDDTHLDQPFLLRIVGLASIVLTSSDRSDSQAVIHAIPEAESLRDTMRKHIESRRDKKRTRVLDIE